MIGQFLNQQRARQATITEVDNGYLILYFPNGDLRKQQVLSVEYTDLLELGGSFAEAAKGRKQGLLRGGEATDKKHPLLPQGYTSVLRAVGYKLDRRGATCVTVCETNDKLYVAYVLSKSTFVIRDQRRQAVSSRQEEIYNAKELARYVREVQEAQSLEAKRHRGGLRVNPYDHLSSMTAALMFENNGAYNDAESLLGQIIKQVPEHPEAHYHVARLALARGDKNAALNASRKAVEIRDELAATHDLYGRVLRLHGKHSEAVAELERAEEIEPHNPIIHQHLAAAYEAVGRTDDAALQMALVSNQTAAPAWELIQDQGAEEAPPDMGDELPDPSSRMPAMEAGPAAAALLPTLAEQGDNAGTLPEPVLTTFDSTPAQPWEQPAPTFDDTPSQAWAQQQPQSPSVPLTAFPLEVVGSWPPAPEPMAAQAPLETSTGSWPPAPQTTMLQMPPAMQSVPTPPTNGQQPGYIQAGWGGAPSSPTQQGYPPAEWLAQPQQGYAPASPAQPPQPAAPMPPMAAPSNWAPQSYTQPSQIPAMQSQEAPPQAPQPAWTPPPSAAPVQPASQGLGPFDPSTPAQQPVEELSTVQLAAEIMLTRRAIEAEPNRAELHRKLGFLLARQGKPAEAAAEFRKALECSRTSL